MKIFLDSSDAKQITELYETGLIDGVTTNPSLMAKSGRDPVDVLKEISNVFPFHASISAEVIGDQWEMLEMADQYLDIGPNITIKVPCTPEGLMVCKELSGNDVDSSLLTYKITRHKQSLLLRQVLSMCHHL